MKRTKFALLILVSFLFIGNKINAQADQEALEYMSTVFNTLDETKNETWKYLKAVTRGRSARKIEKKRQQLIIEIRKTKYEIKKIKVYNGEDSLKNSVIDYLDISYIVLKEDFDKILDMEDIAEQSYDDMEAYILAKEQANDKLDNAFDKVVDAQNTFAAKYDINLIDGPGDKQDQKIKKASEILGYYNDIYLIFFKVYKQEAYVLDAMQRNDVNGMEQNNASLQALAVEALAKIKDVEAFYGDAILINATKKMLNFYKFESERDFPAMIDFYLKKDNFEKITKKFESIKPRNRSKEDINEYNKAVNEYNAAAKKVNKTMQSNNSSRERYLNEFNDLVEKFFDKYSA